MENESMLQTDSFLSACHTAVWNSKFIRFFQVLCNEDYNKLANFFAFSTTVCSSRWKLIWYLSIFWEKKKKLQINPQINTAWIHRDESICSRENPEFIYNCIPLPSTERRICWMYSCIPFCSESRVYQPSHLLHLAGALSVLTIQSVL